MLKVLMGFLMCFLISCDNFLECTPAPREWRVSIFDTTDTIVISGDICENMSQSFDIAVHTFIHDKPNLNNINIEIDSNGGVVVDAFHIISTIKWIKAHHIKVHTFTRSKAASMGAVILSAGEWRTASSSATIMLHTVSYEMYGHIEKLRVEMEQTETLNDMIVVEIANNCHKSPEEIDKFITGGDKYMTAIQAVKFGLIDAVDNE